MWIVLSIIQCTQQTKVDDLSWPEVKSENKPGTYWWWMGSAVDKENLTYNLESLAGAGIGNVHIIPIYGVKGDCNLTSAQLESIKNRTIKHKSLMYSAY